MARESRVEKRQLKNENEGAPSHNAPCWDRARRPRIERCWASREDEHVDAPPVATRALPLADELHDVGIGAGVPFVEHGVGVAEWEWAAEAAPAPRRSTLSAGRETEEKKIINVINTLRPLR